MKLLKDNNKSIQVDQDRLKSENETLSMELVSVFL